MTLNPEIQVGPDTSFMWRWVDHGACCKACDEGVALASWWFPKDGETVNAKKAKAICHTCPVEATCLEWAVKNRESGIWGGTSERQRRNSPVRDRKCVECGTEFRVTVEGGGRQRATCSDKCFKVRRQRQLDEAEERRGRGVGRMIDLGHGRISKYMAGCRCQACKRAARESRQKHRVKKGAAA